MTKTLPVFLLLSLAFNARALALIFGLGPHDPAVALGRPRFDARRTRDAASPLTPESGRVCSRGSLHARRAWSAARPAFRRRWFARCRRADHGAFAARANPRCPRSDPLSLLENRGAESVGLTSRCHGFFANRPRPSATCLAMSRILRARPISPQQGGKLDSSRRTRLTPWRELILQFN